MTTCTGVITKVLPKTNKKLMGFNEIVLRQVVTSKKPKQTAANTAKNKK